MGRYAGGGNIKSLGEKKIIYTTDDIKYLLYQSKIPLLKTTNKFIDMIIDFEVCKIENLSEYI